MFGFRKQFYADWLPFVPEVAHTPMLMHLPMSLFNIDILSTRCQALQTLELRIPTLAAIFFAHAHMLPTSACLQTVGPFLGVGLGFGVF